MPTGIWSSFSHNVLIFGSHSACWFELRQFKGSQRSVAAHRASSILPREYQPLDSRKKEEKIPSKKGRPSCEKQHQPALSIPTCYKRRCGGQVALFFSANSGAGSIRNRKLLRVHLLDINSWSTLTIIFLAVTLVHVLLHRFRNPGGVWYGVIDN